jgi:hypothetical protein
MDRNEARTLLGLDGDVSPEEVRAAYRATLKRWHPDRFTGDPEGTRAAAEQTRRIISAYRMLSERPSRGLTSVEQPDLEVPSFWRQLNPFDESHYRYSPNTVWDGVAITGIVVVGIVLFIILGVWSRP